jgi:pSer/pThr/pTyr-binding forkhead associated (FHA) protein
MAAKIILSMNGAVMQEYPLDKERITIGRKSHNAIVIDNLAVSGEHAAIVTILNDSFLEDLNSTNGLTVNGSPIKKHFLQNNDVIEIGKYKLKYWNDQASQTTAADFEKTMVLRAPPAKSVPKAEFLEQTGKLHSSMLAPQAVATPVKPAVIPVGTIAPPPVAQSGVGVIQILTGPNAGKELELTKNLTTLGKAGTQVVVLTKRAQGYFITYVEGSSYPTLNGKPLGDQPHQLNANDIIELAGVKMEFYIKS